MSLASHTKSGILEHCTRRSPGYKSQPPVPQSYTIDKTRSGSLDRIPVLPLKQPSIGSVKPNLLMD
ncbi:hypothetical protein J0895_22305 [Phormidium pseudopriestleyi FRX01]|uniref:Uncharacterized protein n=1 Tax=Phormidium pseudopriestleyi FRX01 TaxID=1759528 RepID=A0ABS3FXG4_9CYAN|nr:hypothetical protein [Phormidium pseudopriestleyi]MBO0351763.1 hypothetical protein [Phormidium pseudopriestleyi FRX01]